MGAQLVIASAWIFAQAAAPTAVPAEPQAEVVPADEPQPAPAPPPAVLEPEEPVAPLPPPPPPEPPAYGYAGMSELSLALGYSSASGFLGGVGFRRFLVDGIAPGVEATVQSGTGTTVGFLLGSLRVAPVRTRQLAFVVTGRGGRVLLSDHDDGWGAGGGAGIIWFVAPNAGIELGYEILWLLPRSFCADLTSCTVQGPVIGLRFSF